MNEEHNIEDRRLLQEIIDHPHRLGHLLGKTKLTELHSHWIKFLWYPIEYFKENDNWKDTVKFFNKMGATLDVLSEDGKTIERVKLNKKRFFELLENKHRSLQGHRGSYKSTAILIVGAICRMIFEPDIRIGFIRKDFTKASAILKNISVLMKKKQVKELFKIAHGFEPKAIKDRDNILTFNFKESITPEGNINAYGIHASITGDHLDFTVFDDFVTIDDKISRAEREKTKIRIEEVVNHVLDPEKQSAFVGTPWDKDDAWINCPNPLKFDCYMTKLLSLKEINDRKARTTNITFSANMLLKHASHSDAIFKDPSYKRWEGRYRNGIGHIDKKYTGKDTCAFTFCAKKDNGRFQVIGWVWNEHVKTKKQFMLSKWEKYRIGTIHNENNDDKGGYSDIMRSWGLLIEEYHEKMNKHRKIVTHLLENGFFELIDFDPDTDPEYMNQILDYIEGSEPDDAPDSLASIGRILITEVSSVYTNRWATMRENS